MHALLREIGAMIEEQVHHDRAAAQGCERQEAVVRIRLGREERAHRALVPALDGGVERGRLKVDPTWETAAEPGAEEIVFDGQPEWRVTFRHPKPTDRAKQTLYIFVTPTGRFVAANRTGK